MSQDYGQRGRPGRRSSLLLVAWLACLFLVATTARAADSADGWTRDDAAHLLRRAGFGGTPQQIDRLHALGMTGAVEYLLNGKLPEGAAAPFAPAQLEDFHFDAGETRVAVAEAGVKLNDKPGQPPPALDGPPKSGVNPKRHAARQNLKNLTPAKKKNAERRLEIEALRQWWLDRMVRTDRPLEEKMSLFWHGLFCSGFKDIKDAEAMARQNATFHEEALGNYQKLTLAMVHDGAMLKYLNNDQNVKGKPNENLARELMELFTLGEGRGYTEHDIAEVARALTGLAPAGARGGNNGKARASGAVRLRENLHDTGPKTIFGQTGNWGPDDVVRLIFARPEPAEHLARRLWVFFASPDPQPQEIAPVARAIRESNYDVKAGLRALFTSPAFYSERCKFALIKSPAELSVETLRNLEATAPTPVLLTRLAGQLKEMDQELFQPPNVRGWVGGEHWITSATLFTRYNTATAMVNGQIARPNGKGMGRGNGEAVAVASPVQLFPSLKDGATPAQIVDAATDRFIQRPLHPDKKKALLDTLGDAPIHLGQAESDKRVREVLDLVVSSPEYQVH
jgi:uncharacterized protein (DUF1800 family)